MSTFKKIDIEKIKISPKKLRGLNLKTMEYIGLRDSIRDDGFYGAILVREKEIPNTKSKYFELIEGLHRQHACTELGMTQIPAEIVTMEDKEIIPRQIKQNLHHVPTKNTDYSRIIKMMANENVMMTMSELAQNLKVSPQWIRDRLRLEGIKDDNVKRLVNNGEIPLSNAYYLAKLPSDLLIDYANEAKTMKPQEFKPYIMRVVRDARGMLRKGLDPKTKDEFVPHGYLQRVKVIKEERLDLRNLQKLLRDTNTKKPLDVAKLTLDWVLHLDPPNVRLQKAEYFKRKDVKD